MTKEQLTEHWETMEAFKNGIEILGYYDRKKEWLVAEQPKFLEGRLYVINDDHVRERQAFALGKSIEYDTASLGWRPIKYPTFDPFISYRVAKEPQTYYYQWEKMADDHIIVTDLVTDEYAVRVGLEEDGYRKIESSKRKWKE